MTEATTEKVEAFQMGEKGERGREKTMVVIKQSIKNTAWKMGISPVHKKKKKKQTNKRRGKKTKKKKKKREREFKMAEGNKEKTISICMCRRQRKAQICLHSTRQYKQESSIDSVVEDN